MCGGGRARCKAGRLGTNRRCGDGHYFAFVEEKRDFTQRRRAKGAEERTMNVILRTKIIIQFIEFRGADVYNKLKTITFM